MSKFTYLPRHALKRVCQQTKMSRKEVADLLNCKICVDTGHKSGFFRNHLVFNSPNDQTCFVAIQDSRSGTV